MSTVPNKHYFQRRNKRKIFPHNPTTNLTFAQKFFPIKFKI